VPAQYPYNIDLTTLEGQNELLSLWSTARLSVGQAAWIMKLTHDEFYALAKERGVSAPSDKAIAAHNAEIEAHVGPVVAQQEREHLCKQLSRLQGDVRDVAEQIARSKAFAVAGDQ